MERLNQCPQCKLWYPPTENYCEFDGEQLTIGRLMFPRLIRGLDRMAGLLLRTQAWQPRDSKRWRLISWSVEQTTRLARKLDPMDLTYDDNKCIGWTEDDHEACDDGPTEDYLCDHHYHALGYCDPKQTTRSELVTNTILGKSGLLG